MDWLVLTAALPSSPSGLRVRIWRALKATGCATLREGVYILPKAAASADELRTIEQAIRDGGADAHLLELQARDAAQEAGFRALFDRSELYADFAAALKEARKAIAAGTEPALRRLLRGLGQQLQSIRARDFFADQAAARAAEGFERLRLEVERKLSPGEPKGEKGSVQRLVASAFQGRTWATRKRPWIDRLATAWLVRRFVDQRARFVWLDDPKQCPKGAIGFDFDGARFTHVVDKVTFEVVALAFGFEHDPALRRLGELVHYVDVGGTPVDEAAGLETLVRGLQAQHGDDDDLLAAAGVLFDTLYAGFGSHA
ncbi:MAG: chromate resistance protein ChrB domain-containing protein [Caldimonas sp.]